MSYYRYHVFMCTNQREDGRKCCAQGGSVALRAYTKARIKALQLSGRGQIRINSAGCLDRCGLGPVMVIYPEETWYHYKNEADIDEIIEQHLQKHQQVERLILK